MDNTTSKGLFMVSSLLTALAATGFTFFMTALGAAIVFFFSKEISDQCQRLFLGFAAGAMIYVVVEESIPEAHFGERSTVGTFGILAGFVLMMLLDVALG